MAELRPSLQDISYSHEMLEVLWRDHEATPDLLYALMVLVTASAAAQVWTYTEPDPDGWFHVAGDALRHSCRLSRQRWKSARPFFEKYFEITKARWRLKVAWVLIDGGALKRPNIPADMRSAVMVRDNFRCGYCGQDDGPFDCDHIIPVAQGGVTAPDNLLCACQACNRSKGARTPQEWLS